MRSGIVILPRCTETFTTTFSTSLDQIVTIRAARARFSRPSPVSISVTVTPTASSPHSATSRSPIEHSSSGRSSQVQTLDLLPLLTIVLTGIRFSPSSIGTLCTKPQREHFTTLSLASWRTWCSPSLPQEGHARVTFIVMESRYRILMLEAPEAIEVVICHGHRNIRATHPTTFEVTREEEVSPGGDCIIGVGADRAAADLGSDFRRIISRSGAQLETRLRVQDLSILIHSLGSPAMTLRHPTDLVWRRSSYVCDRTVGIRSDFTAGTLPREMVALLRQGETLVVELRAFIPARAP